MLNSSWRLIGSQFLGFFKFIYFIDWQSGGTGKQNISQQPFAPAERPSNASNGFGHCGKRGKKRRDGSA